MSELKVALRRSDEHQPLTGSIPVAQVDAAERFRVNVYVRRRPDGPRFPDTFALGAQPPRKRKYLTSEEFEARHGADPNDVARVTAFAEQYELRVIGTNLAHRTVTVEGTAARFTAAFDTLMLQYAFPGGSYHANAGPVRVPETLRDVIVGVTGLDDRPIAIPSGVALHSGIVPPWQLAAAQNAAAAAALSRSPERASRVQAFAKTPLRADESPAARMKQMADELARDAEETQRAMTFAMLDALGLKTPLSIARLYNFPEESDGSGQTIGIIEQGGGYFRSDLESYFAFLGLPMPEIRDVSVGGAVNSPGVKMDYDSEVGLDICVAGGAAPGAKLVVYFAQQGPQGYIEAMQTAIHDRENRPSIISTSWDLSERSWLQIPMLMDIFDSVLAEAPLLGVTICCSTGDFGAYSETQDGSVWAEYPGSNPHVLACGGTTLVSQGDQTIAEYTWNSLQETGQATGGGVSQRFPLPPWQWNAGVPPSATPQPVRGRGVPDVAGNADQRTGYIVAFNHRLWPVGGTSAVSPLFSALLARINQSLGVNVGYINPYLYTHPGGSDCFRDILFGNNPVYSAGLGWDACTGLGSPDGTKLRDFLGAG